MKNAEIRLLTRAAQNRVTARLQVLTEPRPLGSRTVNDS